MEGPIPPLPVEILIKLHTHTCRKIFQFILYGKWAYAFCLAKEPMLVDWTTGIQAKTRKYKQLIIITYLDS